MSAADDLTALEFERPADVTAWLDAVGELSPAQRRRVEAFRDQWETKLGQALMEVLKRDRDAIAEHVKRNAESISAGSRRAVQVAELVRSGRMDPNEALKELGRLSAEHQQALNLRASLEEACERWDARSSQDGEDYLQEMRSRFPSVGWSQALTHGYLMGSAPSPFMKRGGE